MPLFLLLALVLGWAELLSPGTPLLLALCPGLPRPVKPRPCSHGGDASEVRCRASYSDAARRATQPRQRHSFHVVMCFVQ
eukprot:scaffold1971_cov13-Tisochrysis_lutea.AAC.1